MYRKEHWYTAGAVSLFVFFWYVKTMAPTVTFWDAGEFIASSYTLGIPHPPGTPLFVIIGRVISVLPLPITIAARLNFLSVLCGTAIALLIYLITCKIIENWVENPRTTAGRIVIHGGAAASAFIPCFMRTVWANTTEFEVYAVATATFMFCAWLMTYMGASHDVRRIKRVLLLVVYIISLSIANHMIVLLVSPAVFIYTLMHDRDNWRYWTSVVCLFAGVYLLVMKGLDLGLVFEHLHRSAPASAGAMIKGLNYFGALLGVVFGAHNFIGSGAGIFFGLLITAGSGWWAYRQRSLGFFGAALGLFLLGFSIHLYLLIRANLNPPINEGDPSNLAAFWAVIGREQYGSAYGILPRQVWSLVTGQDSLRSVTDLIDNIVYYFKYNVPFYTKYFGWQYGNTPVTLIFFALGIVGAVKHYTVEKKSFYFWLAVFLITGPILNTYMNFKLGYTQFLDQFPDSGLHEVRDRDYFFIVSFAFYGVWSGLGLAAIVNWVRQSFRMDSDQPLLARPVFGVLALVVFLAALVPLQLNYNETDRSGNYIPSNYARNIMNSLDRGGIIFTNGDNDTFPLWYIQEVEGVRKDCRVVNLSLLNTTWYIKQMRDNKPPVPISYTDEQIDQMQPIRLPKEVNFSMGDVKLHFPKESVMYVKDLMLLDILRTNKWEKPLYFTTTVPSSNRAGLDPYLTMEGAVYRVNPNKASELAKTDSNLAALPGNQQIYMNVSRTDSLLNKVYTYETFFRENKGGEEANERLAAHFAAPYAWLGHIYHQRGELEKAVEANLSARMFFDEPHQWDFTVAQLYAQIGEYGKSLEMMDSFRNYHDPNPNPNMYQHLAQVAVQNGDTVGAVNIIEKSLELQPDYRQSWATLFLIYDSAGNREEAINVINRYLASHPDDQTVRQELEKYRETGEFDLAKAFGNTG